VAKKRSWGQGNGYGEEITEIYSRRLTEARPGRGVLSGDKKEISMPLLGQCWWGKREKRYLNNQKTGRGGGKRAGTCQKRRLVNKSSFESIKKEESRKRSEGHNRRNGLPCPTTSRSKGYSPIK